MRRLKSALALVLALVTTGCLDTGQERVTIRLRVAGTTLTEPVSGEHGWSIELSRAELAFGPFYLCSGYQAGSFCETARMEWTGSVVVNVLDAEAGEGGELHGVTGVVRSWMYDLGITSLLTQQDPLVLAAADDLGANSVRLAGTARKEPHAMPFLAEIPIQQAGETEIGVPIVQSRTSDGFEHDVTGDESTLTVRFDARPWVRDVDFESFLEDTTCSENGPALVCSGGTELTCSESGAIETARDCPALGSTCVRGLGCTEEVRFMPENQAYRAVRGALVAGERPRFEWSYTP